MLTSIYKEEEERKYLFYKYIADKKELQRHVLAYFKTKEIREGWKACKTAKAREAYRKKHESDFVMLDAAKRYFDKEGLKKLPSNKTLQQEIEQLIKKKNALYNEYYEVKGQEKELSTILYNIHDILNSTEKLKEKEQAR